MVASIFVRSFEKIFKLKSKITSKSDQCGGMSRILCHRIELTESVTNLSSLMSWIQFYFNYHILNEFQWHFELALKLAQCNDIWQISTGDNCLFQQNSMQVRIKVRIIAMVIICQNHKQVQRIELYCWKLRYNFNFRSINPLGSASSFESPHKHLRIYCWIDRYSRYFETVAPRPKIHFMHWSLFRYWVVNNRRKFETM